jgi:hypothetical protein
VPQTTSASGRMCSAAPPHRHAPYARDHSAGRVSAPLAAEPALVIRRIPKRQKSDTPRTNWSLSSHGCAFRLETQHGHSKLPRRSANPRRLETRDHLRPTRSVGEQAVGEHHILRARHRRSFGLCRERRCNGEHRPCELFRRTSIYVQAHREVGLHEAGR